MHCETMEDARKIHEHKGLNPCFSGRCTASDDSESLSAWTWSVLILVLVEDALRGIAVASFISQIEAVLILVLVEDALRDP